MANMYDRPPPPPPISSSSYSPPPEPSDDISLLLRQILFKSSSSPNNFSDPKQIMKCTDQINRQQPPPQYSSVFPTLSSSNGVDNNIPVNVIGHYVASSSVGTVDYYDPDEHDSESEEGLEHLMKEMAARPNPNPPRNPSKRTRAAEVHNLSEKRRRSRINEKMKALQKLIPNSNKTDKASMLDEAIEYLKQLQLQVQMLTMRNGINLYSMCAPNQPNQRPLGMNQSINVTANNVNPVLSQHQPSVLDFSPIINQGTSFGAQLGSS